MQVYLERQGHLPERRPASLARIKLIMKSFAALMRYAYVDEGFIGILKNIVVTIAHMDIVLMMTRSGTKHLLAYHPDLLNGSISLPYLSTMFNDSRNARRDILLSHYKYLAARLKDSFYEKVSDRGIELWSTVVDGDLLGICIEFEREHRHEGDLTLSLEMNRGRIYQLSFTIAPGRLVGCAVPQVLLVGRVQGAKERLEAIRRATKLCKYVAPPYLLVSAAQAIALELGVEFVAGVNGRDQLSYTEDFPFDYDSFWTTCSATKTNRNFYVLPAAFPGKPIDQTSPDHRRRKRLKRLFKTRVSECVREAFAERCLTAPVRPALRM